MKYPSNFYSLRSLFVRAATGAMLLCASTSYAQSVYHVDITTGPLFGNVNAPFYVDFQFNDGGILGNNNAVISHFSFSGGSVTGGPNLFGGAVGDIAANNVSFNNNSSFQELFQQFSPGTTLSFNVALTNNSDGATPDAFVVGILDNTTGNIATTGFGSQLAQIDLTGVALSPQTFAGTGAYSGITASVAAIPEPETYALTLAGLGLVVLAARRKKQQAA